MKKRSTKKIPKPDKQSVVDSYINDNLTLGQLHNKFRCNRFWLRNVLKEFGVVVTKKNKLVKLTESHKLHISNSNKGKSRQSKCLRSSKIYKICRNGLSFEYVDSFLDLDRFIFISKIVSRHRKISFPTTEKLKTFFDKFYYDVTFNMLYDNWVLHNSCRQFMPTIDHKIPTSLGGQWSLDNLTFLTWFENRLKFTMTLEDWDEFKKNTNTTSNLFI